MLDYTFINLPDDTCVIPPIGLYSIKRCIEYYNKKTVKIFDMNLNNNLDNLIESNVFGISYRFSVQKDNVFIIKNYIEKKFPLSGILYGGVAANNDESIRSHVVDGPGERLALGENFDLKSIPIPSYTEKELNPYWKINKPHNLKSKTKRWIPFETSRGCNGACLYCGMPKFWGKWKPFGIKYLEAALRGFEQIGIKEIFIEDDNMTHDHNRFISVLKLIDKYGLKWSAPNGIRLRDLLDDYVLDSVIQNKGVWRLSLPFETGTSKSAKLMKLGNKWLNKFEAEYLLKNLNDAGIETAGFFIIGIPGETLDDMQRTLDYANSLDLDDRYIYIATPYKGTALHKLCEKHGYIKEGDLKYSNAIIETEDFKREDVLELKRKDRENALRRRK